MMVKFQPPRGTRDYLPVEMALRRELFGKLRRVFEGFGYGEVSTPAFEDFELLAKKAGQEIEKELYAFTDKSGRKLALRFDPTVPICRIIASNPGLPKPIKWYYITNMWRYDRPQKGRFREFWQAGAELVGAAGAEADAEILEIVSECLKAAGVKSFRFRMGSREVLEKLVGQAGIPTGKKLAAFRALDKLPKIGEAGVAREFAREGIGKAQGQKFLGLVRKGVRDERLESILGLLKGRGIKNAKLDLSVVRGIDYYTGFVFETLVEGFESLGSVASGGRYDTLIGLYGGEPLPATGFGIGIERLAEMVRKHPSPPCQLLVVNAGELFRGKSREVARQLREGGISCETDLMGRSLRKQLEYANARGIPWALFVGEKEVRSGSYTLRDMVSGKEAALALERVKKKLVQERR